MDLVSIVIPTYNRENTILKAIQSVLNQTYKNIEVIVVDDCSTDNTEQKVLNIKDNRVKFYKLRSNQGACAARNEGILHAKGKYIAFQDSDDIWHNNKLEIQLRELQNTGANCLFCDFNKYLDNTTNVKTFPKNCKEGFLSYEELLIRSVVSTQCLIVKKDCLKNIKFDTKMPRLQDWDLILELSKSFSVYHLKTVLVDVYMQNDSISKKSDKGIIALNRLFEKNKEAIINNNVIYVNYLNNMAFFKLRKGDNPIEEYRKILRLKFTFKTWLYYILCKLNILVPVYKWIKK